MSIPHRYVILCEGQPVAGTDTTCGVLCYLWGKILRMSVLSPWRYTVCDYEVPYVVDTADLCAFLARLPAGEPLPRPARPHEPPAAPHA